MTQENIEVQCSVCSVRFVTSLVTLGELDAGEKQMAYCPACKWANERPVRTDDGVILRHGKVLP